MAYRMRGPGYLRGLNQERPEETFLNDLDQDQLNKDLDLFTNTHFYDTDVGQNTDYQAPPVKPETLYAPTSGAEDVSATTTILDDLSSTNIDFFSSDFFSDYTSTYTSPTIPAFPEPLGLQPIQPSPQGAYPPPLPQQHQQQSGYVPNATSLSPHPPHHQHHARMGSIGGVAGVVVGEKRKAEHQDSPPARMLSYEDQSRLAAEEDKRKRNTAASARFRVKKKQREQALEKSAKEMSDKVTMLESRISALETENKWLKGLVTEKHGGGKDDILKKLLKEFAESSNSNSNAKGSGDGHSEDNTARRGSSNSSGSSSDASSSSIASSITAVPAGAEDGGLKKAKRKD